jgi:hypothetical protein
MEIFATAEDYTARYGAAADEARLNALLSDASAMLLSEYEAAYGLPYEKGQSAAFDRAAPAVACMLVNRVLNTPANMAGQGAGSITASVTYGSALGEMYVGKTARRLLGLDGSVRRVLRPIERGEL